jgi:hypothetical protein
VHDRILLEGGVHGWPHLEVDGSPMYFCDVSSGLRFLRFLLFGSERLTEDNEGNEVKLLESKNFVSHPAPNLILFLPPSPSRLMHLFDKALMSALN